MKFHWSGKVEIEVVSDDGSCSQKQTTELFASDKQNLKAALVEYINRAIPDAP